MRQTHKVYEIRDPEGYTVESFDCPVEGFSRMRKYFKKPRYTLVRLDLDSDTGKEKVVLLAKNYPAWGKKGGE